MPVFSDGQKISAALAWDRMIQSVPASYVVWKDGSTYRAECLLKGGTDYSGTDAATVIQSAIDALSNGGTILFRRGSYDISSSITINNENIKFLAEKGTIINIKVNHAFKFRKGNIIVDGFTFQTTDYYKTWFWAPEYNVSVSVDNVIFRNNKFTGYALDKIFEINWKTDDASLAENWWIENNLFENLTVKQTDKDIGDDQTSYLILIMGSKVIVESNIFRDVQARDCIGIAYSAEHVQVINNIFEDFNAISTDSWVVHVGRASTATQKDVLVANNQFIWTKNPDYEIEIAILIDQSSDASSPTDVVVSGNVVVSDVNFTNVETGIWAHRLGTGLFHQISFVNNIIIGVSTSGIIAYGLQDGIIANNIVQNVGQHGIYITAPTQRVIISGNRVVDVGKSASGTYNGIYLYGSECKYNMVVNNMVSDSVPNQLHAIEEANSADYNIIIGNRVEGATDTLIAKVGSNTDVKRNIGYVTENGGTATISSSTYVDVTHGLAGTPTTINVTPATSGTGDWYLSNIGATTFRINVANSGTYTFHWTAEYKP